MPVGTTAGNAASAATTRGVHDGGWELLEGARGRCRRWNGCRDGGTGFRILPQVVILDPRELLFEQIDDDLGPADGSNDGIEVDPKAGDRSAGGIVGRPAGKAIQFRQDMTGILSKFGQGRRRRMSGAGRNRQGWGSYWRRAFAGGGSAQLIPEVLDGLGIGTVRIGHASLQEQFFEVVDPREQLIRGGLGDTQITATGLVQDLLHVVGQAPDEHQVEERGVAFDRMDRAENRLDDIDAVGALQFNEQGVEGLQGLHGLVDEAVEKFWINVGGGLVHGSDAVETAVVVVKGAIGRHNQIDAARWQGFWTDLPRREEEAQGRKVLVGDHHGTGGVAEAERSPV